MSFVKCLMACELEPFCCVGSTGCAGCSNRFFMVVHSGGASFGAPGTITHVFCLLNSRAFFTHSEIFSSAAILYKKKGILSAN